MLELDQLTRRYGENVALDQLSLRVDEGEVLGFLGPNGAGKTTAMRAILGIVRPDSGSLHWKGQPVGLNERLRFGYMPEERGLYTTMLVADQLVYLGRLHGMTKRDAVESATHWLDTLGVADRANDRLDALSMGNQQRVQLAAALVHSPDLLVLDEPFSGLDPVGIEALSNVLTSRARNGAAVMFSSHQLDLVEGLCERVVIINNGRDVITGSVDELTTSEDIVNVLVSDDSKGDWARSIPGTELLGVNDGNVRLRLLPGVSADAVLAAAMGAGVVRHFSFERKRLSEVFREAVTR